LKTLYNAAYQLKLVQEYRVKFFVSVAVFVTLTEPASRTRRTMRPWRGRRAIDELEVSADVRFASVQAATQAFSQTHSTVGRASIASLAIKAADDISSNMSLSTQLGGASASASTVSVVSLRTNGNGEGPKDYTIYYIVAAVLLLALVILCITILKWRRDRHREKLNDAELQLQDPDAWFRSRAALNAIRSRGQSAVVDPFEVEKPARRFVKAHPFPSAERARVPKRISVSALDSITEKDSSSTDRSVNKATAVKHEKPRRKSSPVITPIRLTKTVALRKSLQEGINSGDVQVSQSGQVLKSRRESGDDKPGAVATEGAASTRPMRRSSSFMLRHRALVHLQGKSGAPVQPRRSSMVVPAEGAPMQTGIPAPAPFTPARSLSANNRRTSFKRPRRPTVTLADADVIPGPAAAAVHGNSPDRVVLPRSEQASPNPGHGNSAA
jgi:hypothetical protein